MTWQLRTVFGWYLYTQHALKYPCCIFSSCGTGRNWTPNSCSVRATKGNTWHHSEFVLKCLYSVLHFIPLSDDLSLYGLGIVLSLRAWVHAYCMLMVDVSYIIHAQFTACWHVMMYPLCSEYDLRKKQAVSDNNACMSAPVYIQVCLHYIQMDLLRSNM